jgi:hypothetical protein
VSDHGTGNERPSPGPSPESHEETLPIRPAQMFEQICTVLAVGGTDLIPQG